MNQKSIVTCFPHNFQIRDNQLKILQKINQILLDKKRKFILINAPTGTGKSLISATLANYSKTPYKGFTELIDNNEVFCKDAYDTYVNESIIETFPNFGCNVLTTTKALQNQYKSLFEEIEILKGKQNYKCTLDETFNCDFAPCTIQPDKIKKCILNNNCEYNKIRNNTLKSKFSTMNYNVFLGLPEFIRKKEFLICDEASQLEDILVNHYSCKIDYNALKPFKMEIDKLKISDSQYVYTWLCELYHKIQKEALKIIVKVAGTKKQSKILDPLKIKKYKFLKNYMEKIGLIVQTWEDAEYIIENDDKKVQITPLYVNALAQNMFKNIDHVILMSATIINHRMYANTLGIKDYDYIEVDSEFEAKKSPIYINNKIKLNYDNIDRNLIVLSDYIKNICESYKEKGIIHTHTQKITDFIKKRFNNSRFLYRDENANNEQILEEHKERVDDTILVSPSLTYGIDLYDHLSRFQIIIKTPFLPLGDKRIKAIFDKNKQWYEMKTLINLIQMCGRSTRNKDDYSDTFILDGTAIDLIQRNIHNLPKYFIDRII